jgi:hypothetical protein
MIFFNVQNNSPIASFWLVRNFKPMCRIGVFSTRNLGRKVFPIWSTKSTLPLYGIKVSMNFHLVINLWKVLQLTRRWIILLALLIWFQVFTILDTLAELTKNIPITMEISWDCVFKSPSNGPSVINTQIALYIYQMLKVWTSRTLSINYVRVVVSESCW